MQMNNATLAHVVIVELVTCKTVTYRFNSHLDSSKYSVQTICWSKLIFHFL